MDADGTNLRQLTDRVSDSQIHPNWSADGGTIAFASSQEGQYDIFLMTSDGSQPRRLSGPPVGESSPAQSPDGTKLAFTTDGDFDLVITEVSGSELKPERVITNAAQAAWSPEGDEIVFTKLRGRRYWDLYSLNLEEPEPKRLTQSPGMDYWPTWSPDGARIAFMRDVDFVRGEGYTTSDLHLLDLISFDIENLTEKLDLDVAMQPAWRPEPTRTTQSSSGS